MHLSFILWSVAVVPSSQPEALQGFLIIAPPSVCVPDVIGALTVWIQNSGQKKKKTLVEFTCALAVCIQNQKKTKIELGKLARWIQKPKKKLQFEGSSNRSWFYPSPRPKPIHHTRHGGTPFGG